MGMPSPQDQRNGLLIYVDLRLFDFFRVFRVFRGLKELGRSVLQARSTS